MTQLPENAVLTVNSGAQYLIDLAERHDVSLEGLLRRAVYLADVALTAKSRGEKLFVVNEAGYATEVAGY